MLATLSKAELTERRNDLIERAQTLEARSEELISRAKAEGFSEKLRHELNGLDRDLAFVRNEMKALDRAEREDGDEQLLRSVREGRDWFRGSAHEDQPVQVEIAAPGAGRRTFRSLFPGEPKLRQTRKYTNFAELAAAVAGQKIDDGLVPCEEARSILTGMGDSGDGVMVPEVLAQAFVDSLLRKSIVLSRARIVPMAGPKVVIPAFDGEDHSSSTHGGFVCAYIAEGVDATETDPKFRGITLNARKLGLFFNVSNEALSDAPALAPMLERGMSDNFSFKNDEVFIRGDGASEPLGFLNCSSAVVVAADAGPQAADTVTISNLSSMEARLHPAFDDNAVWLAHPSTRTELRTLTIDVGTDGAHIPVFRESGGRMKLLEREVLFSEHMSTLGDEGDLALVDLSQYAVGLRREFSIEKTNAVKWLSDQTSFRATMRHDGAPLYNSPITPAQGSTTLSWAVILGARTGS